MICQTEVVSHLSRDVLVCRVCRESIEEMVKSQPVIHEKQLINLLSSTEIIS